MCPQILTNGIIDIDKYKNYSPPFFSGANVFGQGAWFAWYPMTLFYMFITQWTIIPPSLEYIGGFDIVNLRL